MKLYGGGGGGGESPRNIAPLLRGGANLLGGRKSCDTGIPQAYVNQAKVKCL